MMGHVLFGRKVTFRASHHYELKHLSQEENRRLFGEASEIHEHRWELTLWLQGPVAKETGMMLDLIELDSVLNREVVQPFDQQHINQADAFFTENQPTTEVLAKYFAERLIPQLGELTLVRLRIAECDDLFAEWVR